MYLVAIAWIYITLMMAVAEANHPSGTVLGGIVTFLFYGLLPTVLVMYLMGTPLRRHSNAPIRPSITSLTTMWACQNRVQNDMSICGAACATSAGFILSSSCTGGSGRSPGQRPPWTAPNGVGQGGLLR